MKWLKPFFSYSMNEKRGIVILVLLIIIILGLRIYLPYIIRRSDGSYFSIKVISQSIEGDNTIRNDIQVIDNNKKNATVVKPFTKEMINPNNASLDELIRAGFSEFGAKNIIKYRQKGGWFFKPEDLYKIYGIDSSYSELISNIIINKNDIGNLELDEFKLIQIDLNLADTLDLQTAPGIGSVLSNRILKYKKLIGGFYSLEQLKEVYGITDSTYNNIKDHFYISKGCCKKINLNKASENMLCSHPYINKHEAKSIIQYRKLIGDFNNPDELLESNIFTKIKYQKLKPYLEVE